MSDNNIQAAPVPPTKDPVLKVPTKYGWLHLLIRFLVLLTIIGTLSYLQEVKIMSTKSLDSKLIIPALAGLLMSIMNWHYLVKISILLLPIWFAASIAIAFSGIILLSIVEMPYESGSFLWLDILVEYVPAAIAGHWLFSGYSRMGKGKSFWGYIIVVGSSVIMVFLLYRVETPLYILQPLYFSLLCAGLCLTHFEKQK